MRRTIIAASLSLVTSFAYSAEYCVDQYQGEISKANSELASIVKRQAEVDARLAKIFTDIALHSNELSQAAAKIPPDVQTIQRLGKIIGELNREKVVLESEGYKNNDRTVALKGTVPADLQGKLRGCIEATAPANNLVNFAIQALAIASTGGLALALPPKSLYVDMSAVLNGYPTGGPDSVVNQAREAALRALPGGMGSANNDIGRVLRDPGVLLRCPLNIRC